MRRWSIGVFWLLCVLQASLAWSQSTYPLGGAQSNAFKSTFANPISPYFQPPPVPLDPNCALTGSEGLTWRNTTDGLRKHCAGGVAVLEGTGGGGGSGSVLSVGLVPPGGTVFSVTGSPVTVTGNLTLTVTGTSGGVPFFSSSSALSSSGLLVTNQLMLGGGAGTAPATLGTSGTATTLLHGNASGPPSFGAVNLASDTSGILSLASGGTNASSASAALINLMPTPVGDGSLAYWNGTIWATLAGNTTGTRILQETSTGVPSWVVAAVGSVTSVNMTVPGGGLFAVSGTPITTAGTLALTVSGNVGGIPYFNTASTLTSSGTLAMNALMLGGGSGNPPITMGSFGTTVTVLHGNASGAPSFGAVSLSTDVSSILPIPFGGTNAATATAGFNNLAPIPTRPGDVIYWSGASWVSLAGNNTGTRFLQENASGVPSWAAIVGSGTVTSVDMTVPGGGMFAIAGTPITTTGTLALTVTGTSGGIPYFASASTLTSSAVLTANRIVLGGGAATAPAVLGSLGTTTTLLHGNAAGAPTFGAVALADHAPGVTAGDIQYWNGTAWVLLPGNNSGTQVLQENATGVPSWASIAGSGTVTSVALAVPGGGLWGISGSPVTTSGTITLTATGNSGGIPYFASTSTLSSSAVLTANRLMLGGGAGVSPSVLGSLGTTVTVLHGNAGGAPSFGAVNLSTDITGTLALANGGTGLTAGTSGGILAFTSSGTLVSSAALTANALVLGGGAGAVPTVMASLGTTTTFLRGNASGAPTWTAINVATDITGIALVANGGTGAATLTGMVIGNGTSAFTALPFMATHAALLSTGAITASAENLKIAGSGTAVNLSTANPQILDGFNGQCLTLFSDEATNVVTLNSGRGLRLCSGESTFVVGIGSPARFCYDSGIDLWVKQSCGAPAAIPTLQQAKTAGAVINDATDVASAVILGSSTGFYRVYGASGIPVLEAVCNTNESCPFNVMLGVGKDFGVYNSASSLLLGVSEAGLFTGSMVQTQLWQTRIHDARLMTTSTIDANAFIDQVDGTNFDYSGLLFKDALTGCGFFKHKIQPNLATTPAWNIVMTHKAFSGAGGNVVLTVSAKSYATNVALDTALTALHTAATFAVSTSANTTLTTLSGSNYDSVVPLTAGNFLVISICRVGGNGSDSLNADWWLLDTQIRYAEAG